MTQYPYTQSMGLFDRLVYKLFHQAYNGSLQVVLPNQKTLNIGEGNQVCRLEVKKWRFFTSVLLEGTNGVCKSYINGDLACNDLLALFKWGLDNQNLLDKQRSNHAILKFIRFIKHQQNKNTLKGSQKNISYHYDLGNDFYEHWLDQTMTYSSALYLNETDSLQQAQENKYQYIIDKLDIQKDQSVVEIGLGWGGFSRQLLEQKDVSYTGVSLSKEQLVVAHEKCKHPLQADFRYQDYRDLTGTYDRIVSIEMFEAVGKEYWDTYFEKLNTLLNENGKAVLQVITIKENRFDRYQKDMDFIQKYIFPGGMLPTNAIMHELSNQYNFKVKEQLDFGLDYAKTLQTWWEDFNNKWDSIAPLGYDEKFKNMWNLYLKYCQAGFESQNIDVRIYVLEKQGPIETKVVNDAMGEKA